jgi:Dolichyl-phosphate-mannose-protein mannosyltransferase
VNEILLNKVLKEHCTPDQPERRKIHNPPYLRFLQWLLYAIAILAFTWPVYRAFLNIEITDNEGWNAYFADAAMGKMPLYPSTAQLITNNYPPLSFYIVGLAGRLIGDAVLAGRLLSLISVIAIATAIALSVRRLGGTQAAAVISAAFYIAMMSRFFRSYVGLDEPELLSHAIMAFGFLAFLGARSRDRGYVMPVLVMAFAGFVKHNIIAMPLTAFAWLGMNRRREALKCLCVAAVVIVTGIAICYVSFGRDFFLNILAPRHYSLKKAIRSVKDLQWVLVGLVACVCNGCARWHDRSVRLCTGLIAIGLAAFFLQRTGAGVWTNAQFDLVIAVAIGLGLAYTQVPLWPVARRFPPAVAQAILLLVVCARLLVPKQLEPIRLLVDRRFKNEIAIREQAMADSVERVRRTPGDVLCPTLISYHAGKPFAVDKFNAEQRMSAGALPKDAVTARVAAGTLTIVKTDPRASWSFRLKGDTTMGSQAALYVGAEDLGEEIAAWQKKCAGKTQPDCSRNLDALRKKAFKLAEFAQSKGDLDRANVNNVPDPVEGDGVDYETGKVNGWRANWRVVARLVRYHAECFNRYDTSECKAEWAAFQKEQKRVRDLYGPDARFEGFPSAFKERTFGPYVATHVARELASHWHTIELDDGNVVEVYSAYSDEVARNKFDFVINPNLPPDCVELSPEGKPPKGSFYKSDPLFRPKNVPDNFILVKVYQHGDFLGYVYLDKNAVEGLHGRK